MSSERLTLPAHPASVPMARRFVRERLDGWGLEHLVDTVTMLVSELATNAVLHARTAFAVQVSREGKFLRVGLFDHSAAVPRARRYGVDSTTGRGLRLVDTLSADWGVDRQADGKTIWFQVPIEAEVQAPVAWDDEADVDVDALLAAFDDDESSAPVAEQLRAA